MNDQATSPGCPDLETISAVFDGECVPDETARAHLDSCPDCARRQADYRVIRSLVMQAVASEPDPGFDARIAAFVRAESAGLAPVVPKKRDFSNSRTAWVFRIAALFILSVFFVYLLTDQMHANRAKVRPHVAEAGTMRPSGKPIPSLDAGRGAGDFVKARLVSNTPSSQQYAIDIDPLLVPDEFEGIPGDSRIPLPLRSFSGQDGDGATQRIPLREDSVSDALHMLESIRRDLIALNVPGLSVDAESRGKSLFTTIRLESAGQFDMSVMKTDDNFELFLMSGDVSGDEGPVVFRLEFFFE